MQIQSINSIHEVDVHKWNQLWNPTNQHRPYPFTQHEFLAALEDSGSTSAASGWEPQHLLVWNQEQLLAAMPMYIKHHSYGEYVFDWAWAEAYNRHGLAYYPKLLCAIPFTPSTGPRLAFSSEIAGLAKKEIFAGILGAIKAKLDVINGSSFHCLFPDKELQQFANSGDLLQRQGCQFHWFNQEYTSFDDFLLGFNSRKRKAIKKERKKVSDQDVSIQFREASEVSPRQWQSFYALYHRTYLKRSGRYGYLNEDFFLRLAKALPKQVLLASVCDKENLIAGALYLRDETTLYGRYWGSCVDIDGLHFEACYYRGIEYAIAQGLARFDPGAQGEHKIQRGFTPVLTCSYHWLAHSGFQQAITHFIEDEQKYNLASIKHYQSFLPFKEGVSSVDCEILLDNSIRNF